MPLSALFALILFCLCQVAAATEAALPLLPGQDRVEARPYARYYDESEPTMTLARAMASPDLFQATGRHRGAAMHWLRLAVVNAGAAPGRWLLDLGVPDAEYLAVYQTGAGGVVTLANLGPDAAYAARPAPTRMLAVPVALAAGERAELFLRYRTHADTPLSLELYAPEHYSARLARADLGNGAVLGVLLALTLFALLQYLATGQAAFLAYVGVALSMMAFLLQFEGYNFGYLWPTHGAWNQQAPVYMATCIQLAHTLFAMSLFDTRRRFPRLHRIFLAYLTLLPANLILYLGAGWVWPTLAMALAYVPLVLAGGVFFLRQGRTEAGFFLAGTAVYILFNNLLFGLSVFGFGPDGSPFLLPKIGYVCEALFFALALARQMQTLRRQVEDGLRLRLAESEQLARIEAEKHRLELAARERQLQFAAAGHDLCQPLASIRFALAALRARDGNEVATRHIDQALDYTDTLLRGLIDDARDGHAQHRQASSLDRMLAEARQRHQSAAEHKGLALRRHPTGYRAEVSELVLARILDNLIGNAIRYTARGGILIGVRRRPDGLEIQVHDTGPGFDTAQRDRLLAPFEQGDAAAAVRQGHGLGLHIVQALCAQSGYRLTVCSKPGRGSRFGIVVPR